MKKETIKIIKDVMKVSYVTGFAFYWMFTQPDIKEIEKYINQKNNNTPEIIIEYENTKKNHNTITLEFTKQLRNTNSKNYKQNISTLNQIHKTIDSLELRLQELTPQYDLELKTNKSYSDSIAELSKLEKKYINHKSRLGIFFTSLMMYFGMKLRYSLEKE